MDESKFTLEKPPIIEAIVDIECDLPPKFQVDSLVNRAQKDLAKQYPHLRRQHVQEHQFEALPDKPPKVSVKGGGVIALQFIHTDEKQIIQYRSKGFTFNRLAPYSGLDDYLPQIKKAWLGYVKLASPIQVRMVRLRYINRLLLPFIRDKIEINDYLRHGPKMVDEGNLSPTGFLIQYTAVDNQTDYQVNSVLTAQAPEDDKWPIIFDNSATSLGSIEPDDWRSIRAKIDGLRILKNQIFEKTLTKKCLNLFQQP